MKNSVLFLFVFTIQISFAQQVAVKMRVKIPDTLVIDKYKPDDNGFKYTQLSMQPGDFRIQNQRAIELLRSETVVGVDLVYSDYPEGEDFTELNRRRLVELYGALPEAFNRSVVSWRVVKQTGVQKTGGINNYFHGFTIYFRPMPTYYAEETLIKDILDGKAKPEDSTILKVFERHEEWKDMLVVCDVTGSMSPYTAQLLLWIKANQKLRNMKNIIFFNDDDLNSSNQKIKEDEFGMWSASSKDYDKVIEVAMEAMNKGRHIENNLEAVCAAIKKHPEDKLKVVMIADNWEDPCDMQLLSYLKEQKIPIRIIVCGVNARFNTNYLDIARATGGSVHTMEEDLVNLALMKEGTTFKIGDMKFRLSNGKYYQVNK